MCMSPPRVTAVSRKRQTKKNEDEEFRSSKERYFGKKTFIVFVLPNSLTFLSLETNLNYAVNLFSLT